MRFIPYTYKSQVIIVPYQLIEKKTESKRISEFVNLPQLAINSSFTPLNELQTLIQGKQLLLDEIPIPLKIIHDHYLNGFLHYQYGVFKQKEGYLCKRCGNNGQHLFGRFPCARCHEQCAYCRKCITMGKVSECSPLITWTRSAPSKDNHNISLKWEGKLSPGQQKASEAVVEAVKAKQELLVWAVCGSGKTEVLFKGLEKALSMGLNVCLTTPRTDVVHELTPRMKSVFPTIEILSLYGGSEDRGKSGQLVIATTHQLLRYYKWFDVAIIDEVDAFPYSTEKMLKYAVNQAKKEQSSSIYLTATPDYDWQKRVKKKQLPYVTIPARYHRHPLPVPQFKWCGNWRKSLIQKKFPTTILRWIQVHLELQKQAFLFIPRIELLDDIVSILKKEDPRIEGVHAEDPNRKIKVDAFRQGQIPLIVTTTILERGVTVANTDVAVLGAEDGIFTESALVQISGRVGRSATFPSGEVIFFHFGKSNAMVAAKKHIEAMNKEGREKGLLD